MKDYLILLAGTPRGGIQTWKSLIKYVKNPLDCDIALVYGHIFEMPKYLLNHSKFDWQFEEPQNWRDFYEKNFPNSNAIKFMIDGEKYGMAGGIDDYSGSGAIVSGFKTIVFNNYMDEISQYKYIIHSRFDQFYVDYHPKYTGDKIWIPKGEDYYGVCDRHAVFPVKYCEQYFGISNFLSDKKAHVKMTTREITPESVFLENLRYQGLEGVVERIDRFQFTAAVSSDETRWRKAIYKIYFSKNLLMKYPDEFLTSIQNSLKRKKLTYFFKHPLLCINYFYLRFRQKVGEYINTR